MAFVSSCGQSDAWQGDLLVNLHIGVRTLRRLGRDKIMCGSIRQTDGRQTVDTLHGGCLICPHWQPQRLYRIHTVKYIYAAMVPINTCRLYATVATAGLAQEALHYTFCQDSFHITLNQVQTQEPSDCVCTLLLRLAFCLKHTEMVCFYYYFILYRINAC